MLFEDKPLGRAYVHVYSDAGTNFRGMGLASVPAGEDGRFRIKLPPGSYYVLARKRQGGGMYGPPGKDDYIGYYPGNPVTVRPGAFTPLLLEATTRVDLLEEIWFTEGASAGWFEGKVTEAAGKPAAGLYVLFYTDEAMSGTPAFVAGPTDAKGHFKVRAAAGKFHLLARSNLGGPLETGSGTARRCCRPAAHPRAGSGSASHASRGSEGTSVPRDRCRYRQRVPAVAVAPGALTKEARGRCGIPDQRGPVRPAAPRPRPAASCARATARWSRIDGIPRVERRRRLEQRHRLPGPAGPGQRHPQQVQGARVPRLQAQRLAVGGDRLLPASQLLERLPEVAGARADRSGSRAIASRNQPTASS